MGTAAAAAAAVGAVPTDVGTDHRTCSTEKTARVSQRRRGGPVLYPTTTYE